MEVKWRFPASNYGDKKGISSGDGETFKKYPYQSFAREILQNSIDVRVDDSEPVEIVFNEFKIKTKDIPGIEEYKAALGRCIELWKFKTDYVEEYSKRLQALEADEIECLRISDFNTTGLQGIDTPNPEKNFFLALVKGSGVSEKSGSVSGGSKGLGKNAAVILSKFGLVFYTTKTNNTGAIGSIGIADLISGYLEGDTSTENRDYTQGKGFYGSDGANSPIADIIKLDSSFNERNVKTGTDIYIIGFKKTDDWQNEVINGILESFMVAVMRKDLVVKFNDVLIDDTTVEGLINSDIIFPKNLNSIVSQYILAKGGDDIIVRDIETDYGNPTLYVKVFKKGEIDYSTHKCSMIRYPLMKIKNFEYSTSYNISAMCIIPKGVLGEKLRNIENAQHIDWETSRITDASERKEIRDVLTSIKTQIVEHIQDILQTNMSDSTDVEGAGEYLPSVEKGENKNQGQENENNDSNDQASRTKIRPNVPKEKNPREEDENGSGLVPDIGDVDNEPGDVEHPDEHNGGGGGAPHPGPDEGTQKPGDNVIFVRQKLAGVRYKVISLDKSKGLIRIIFTSPVDCKKCSLCLLLVDDTNKRSNVDILSLNHNGKEIVCDNPLDYGFFEIKLNEKVVLDVKTNQTDYFACEVKVYANKE